MTKAENTAHAPETVEGWYALHQVFRYSGKSRREGDDRDAVGASYPRTVSK